MTIKLLLIFAVTELLLSMTPGPAVLLVISQGMRFNARRSVRGAAGILTGNAIYFALSAVGLGTLLVASASLFQIIKWLGAGYLVFIGIRMLLSKNSTVNELEQANEIQSSRRLFTQGLVTQLSNPKAIVFFTALLPQFLTTNENVAWQLLILGAISIAVEFPVLLVYGWLAEHGRRLVFRGKLATLPDRIAGVVLIGAGLTLAAIRKP